MDSSSYFNQINQNLDRKDVYIDVYFARHHSMALGSRGYAYWLSTGIDNLAINWGKNHEEMRVLNLAGKLLVESRYTSKEEGETDNRLYMPEHSTTKLQG